MPHYDFTVFGTATTVKVFRFNRFPQVGVTTSTVNGDFDTVYFGGMGYNVSAALAKLGCGVNACLVYSDKRCEAEFERVREECGLEAGSAFYSLPDGVKYATCYMFEDENGDNMTFGGIYTGVSENIVYTEVKRKRHVIEDSMVRNSDWVILTCPSTTEEYEDIVECVKRNNSKMVFSMRNDPRIFNRDNLRKGISASTVLIANESETEAVVREFDLECITDLFNTTKLEIIVQTIGSKGSRVYEKTAGGCAVHTVGVTCAQKIDIVGAGDAYEAGFMYALVKGYTIEQCAQIGSTLSAFVIEKDGSVTNLPTEEMLLERTLNRPDAKKELFKL